jgi:two-component system, cell cycle response regulator DivK
MTGNPIILYVEDDPNSRLLIKRILMAEGYVVLEAADSVSTLHILKNTQPDLILMDINLPEVDGYSLTAQIREQLNLRHVPIVALTANVMRGDRERTLAAGCVGYIQKPINVDTLPDQIQQYLMEARDG